MAEEKEASGWRRKFIAARMVVESVLFEKELITPKKERLTASLAGIGAIFIFHAVLLSMWILRAGHIFRMEDAAAVNLILEYLKNFDSGSYFSLLKPLKAGIEIQNPPLYYLTFIPFLKVSGSNFNAALVGVNLFYTLIFMLSIFFIVKRNRNDAFAWLAVLFASGFPFFLEIIRHPSHTVASIALVALAYCFYLNSVDFMKERAAFWFGVSAALGFFCDKYFWIYLLPLAPALMTGLVNPLAREGLLKSFLAFAALNFLWYSESLLRFLLYGFIKESDFSFKFYGVFHHLKNAADLMQLPFFIISSLALLWMYYAVFMPYSHKKLVAMWFVVPYAVFTVLGLKDPLFLYPCLAPFAVSAGIMTPNIARKYLMGFAVFLILLNQSGLVPAKFAGPEQKKFPLFGLPLPGAGVGRCGDILEIIGGEKISGHTRIAVIGGDSLCNAHVLSAMSRVDEYSGFRFHEYAPEFVGLADFVLYKADSAPSTSLRVMSLPNHGGKFSEEFQKKWFLKHFSVAAVFDAADSSKIIVYKKNTQVLSVKPQIEKGFVRMDKISVGEFQLEDIMFNLGPFDLERGVYESAGVFLTHIQFGEVDVYGLDLQLKDFAASGLQKKADEFRPLACGEIKIKSAKLNDYPIKKFIESRNKKITDVRISMEDAIIISGDYKGTNFEVNAVLDYKYPKIRVRFSDFRYGRLRVPLFMLKILSFDFYLPDYVKFDRISVKKGLIVISSK